ENGFLHCYGISKNPETNEFIIVLDYAQGGDLRKFLIKNHKTLKWEDRLQFAMSIAKDLKVIHEADRCIPVQWLQSLEQSPECCPVARFCNDFLVSIDLVDENNIFILNLWPKNALYNFYNLVQSRNRTTIR
ncbi:15570_t:CDS:2, partial [Dentiscutata heterogama]